MPPKAGDKHTKFHGCVFSRMRTEHCLFIYRFQVMGQVEDNACAVITKKGVFSEKCCNESYWICQHVISSDNDF